MKQREIVIINNEITFKNNNIVLILLTLKKYLHHNSILLFKLENSIFGRRQKSQFLDYTDDLYNLFDSLFNENITNIMLSLSKHISIYLLCSPINILTSFFYLIIFN